MAALQLRPYQREAIDSVLASWNAGTQDVLGTAATGSGKTSIFLALIVEYLSAHGGRALIVAHRKELIDQPIARLAEFFPAWLPRAGVVMADQDECDRQIVVATVQTLGAEGRLERILRHGPITILVTDEAHHAVADTYGQVYARLREANPALLHLGVTATPRRADGEGLRQVYDAEAFHYGIKEMVQSGYLVPPRWLAIKTGISLAEVAKRDGDFVEKQLANVFETQECFDLVVKTHQEYARDRPAMAFTVDVDGAYRLAEAFNKAGVRAEAADGTTKKRERADILTRFRRGETQVICNCALFTEGLDLPTISCLHQVRPTRSDSLYVQMIGRALRPLPGKVDALILDYCPAETRDIVLLGDVLGSPVRKDVAVEDAVEKEPGEVIGGFTFDGKFKWLKSSAMEIVSSQLDYLDLTPWSWFRSEEGWLSLGLGQGADGFERTLLIAPPDAEGNLTLYGVRQRRKDPQTGEKLRGRQEVHRLGTDTFETVSALADKIIARHADATLAARNRQWRKQAPSEAQVKFAQTLKVWTPGTSRGEVAQRITHKLARRAVEKGV